MNLDFGMEERKPCRVILKISRLTILLFQPKKGSKGGWKSK